MTLGPHASHVTRISMDASTYDEICINCGATDEVPGGWGALADVCQNMPTKETTDDPCELKMDAIKSGRRCVLGTEGCITQHRTRRGA